VEFRSKWFVNTVYEGVCIVVASHVSGVDKEGLLLILNVMSFLEWLNEWDVQQQTKMCTEGLIEDGAYS